MYENNEQCAKSIKRKMAEIIKFGTPIFLIWDVDFLKKTT